MLSVLASATLRCRFAACSQCQLGKQNKTIKLNKHALPAEVAFWAEEQLLEQTNTSAVLNEGRIFNNHPDPKFWVTKNCLKKNQKIKYGNQENPHISTASSRVLTFNQNMLHSHPSLQLQDTCCIAPPSKILNKSEHFMPGIKTNCCGICIMPYSLHLILCMLDISDGQSVPVREGDQKNTRVHKGHATPL